MEFYMYNMRDYLITQHLSARSNQAIFKFDNGYGASVIQGLYTYGGNEGLFEVAVLRFINDDDYEICYDTPITEDVLGYLSENEVMESLRDIRNLSVSQLPTK